MKIAILGTRGVPNQYGGFEQFAQYLSQGLVQKGHHVSVYSPHTHPYQAKQWEGVHILHQYDPEAKLGTAGQFIYDLNCILDSRQRGFDIILQLGYTSSSVWHWLLPQKSVVITNMDGLEWKRTKYSKRVQSFLKYAEKLGVLHSDYLVADSLGIQNYLQQTYSKESTFIPYGATVFNHPDSTFLDKYTLQPFQYNLLIARLEPENNIETILEGSRSSHSPLPFLVIGNFQSVYGKYLINKFPHEHIRFIGSVYDMQVLDNLRHFCHLYFHGHTVGGTNPSLLEAMASGALICAHQNEFNSHILKNDAYYFEESKNVAAVLDQPISQEQRQYKTQANIQKIASQYAWGNIIEQYECLMKDCLRNS